MVFGIFRPSARAALIVAGLLLLTSVPTHAYITDSTTQRPPTTGGYAYYSTYGTFGPDRAGFPATGQTFVDPVFGSTIRRLTKDFPNGSASDIYAKNGFWNADGTRMIHGTGAGYTIVDTTTGAVVRTGVPGNYDGSFAPDDPDTWYYFSGSSLQKYSISTGTTALVKTFGATLGSLGGSVDWIDASGRYMVLKIGATVRVWDKSTDTLYAGNIPGAADAGWVGISPDGKYVVATSGDVDKYSYAINHATRSVNTTGVLFWTLCGDHGDLVSASNGKTYLVTAECYSEAGIYAVDVSIPQTAANRDKQRSDNRKLFHYDWNDDVHFSGVAKGTMRDWAFVSVESYDDGFTSSVSTWRPFKQEIVMANVVTGEVRRMAHHRSRGLPQSYYYQPRVSASWTGGKVAWASNFGYQGADYADIYAIDIAGASTPPPPPGGDTTLPTVGITAPAPSSTVSGTVTLKATASDDVGVVGVQFYVNGAKRGIEDTVAPYERTWDTMGMTAGTYTIKATARDAAGNTRSHSITVIVKTGATTTGTLQNVVWVDTRNVTFTNTSMTKSAGCDGCPDAGAGSAQTIASGDGFIQFTATTGPMGYFGFVKGTTKYDGAQLPYVLAFQDAYVTVYESGAYRADTAFVTGDVFGIHIEGGVVTYKKNGTVFYRSTVAPGYPLRANAALLNLTARVSNAVISAAVLTASTTTAPTTQDVAWTDRRNVIVTASALTKSGGCGGCPDAGARSVQRIADGRGWLQFAVASPSGLGYVGLTNGGATTDGSALPFALRFQGAYMSVYESGVYRADVPLRAGDIFRIAVSVNGIVSYLRNGVVFHRSTVRATYPLRAAAALYDAGTTVARALIR